VKILYSIKRKASADNHRNFGYSCQTVSTVKVPLANRCLTFHEPLEERSIDVLKSPVPEEVKIMDIGGFAFAFTTSESVYFLLTPPSPPLVCFFFTGATGRTIDLLRFMKMIVVIG
jgi:hypothetical protein